MQTPNATTLTLLGLLPLIVWRMVVRVRRLIGRQRLSKVRPWITLIVFPLLLGLLALSAYAHAHADRLVWLALGLAAGGALGIFGLRKTVFEPTREGLYYTPNMHLGIALSLLFVGRILYRLVEVLLLAPPPAGHADDFATTPLTLGVVGLLAGYYISYAIGLLRWRRRVLKAKRLREAAEAERAPDAS